MDILLSVEAENRYYLNEITYKDLREELKSNGFEEILDDFGNVKDFKFKNRILDELRLRENKDFSVYMVVTFK